MSTRIDTPENQPFYLPHSLNWPWCCWVVSFICLHDRACGTGRRWVCRSFHRHLRSSILALGFCCYAGFTKHIHHTDMWSGKKNLGQNGKTREPDVLCEIHPPNIWKDSMRIWQWKCPNLVNMLYRSDESCGPQQQTQWWSTIAGHSFRNCYYQRLIYLPITSVAVWLEYFFIDRNNNPQHRGPRPSLCFFSKKWNSSQTIRTSNPFMFNKKKNPKRHHTKTSNSVSLSIQLA